ncbi:AMP-binding protein [Nakamurella sp. YIM 132087]|uniref:AMP-binding protein n=1 Tax=Nakamurella alba TaxID=2665158 RepID=A0A7K1FT18_9ACTN|nr:AMP-binding protein [Nakamurella alba]MTD16323.1 AMP-binding protein [Nakamurella alba]
MQVGTDGPDPVEPGIDTIPQAAARSRAVFGDLDALVGGDIRLTFREYVDRARRVAGGLLGAGLVKGDRVAVWAPNSVDWAVTALGVHLSGCVLLPLNTRFTAREAAQMIVDADCRLVFTVGEFLGHRYQESLTALYAGAEAPAAPAPRIVRLDDTSMRTFLDSACSADDVAGAAAAVGPDDIATMLFTSGTTGRPKGAMLRHRALLHGYWRWSGLTGLTAGDRFLVSNPFFHAFGLKVGLLSALVQGATVHPVPVFDAEVVLDLIESERITYFPGPPTVFQSLMASPTLAGRDISSLRTSVVGATSIRGALIEDMYDVLGFERVHVPYGFTEATGLGTMTRAGDPRAVVAGTAGRPVPGLDMTLEREDGTPVGPGEEGEIVVRGQYVMAGYLDPATGRPVPVDPAVGLRSGDLGRWTPDGDLVVSGRIKDLVIVGGFNVYPAEVEAALCEHPAVASAAVIGMADERLGEVPVAFVVLGDLPGSDPGVAEGIRAWSRERLANFKVPRRIVVVDALPLNASGKVVKAMLKV